MKSSIIIFLMFITLKSYAQEYPLKTSSYDISPYSYIKDTNNDYNKYIGLWKGSWNGKTIYIELKKIKRYYDGNNPYYMDKLFGERKIISSSGNIEIDRISNFNSLYPEISGMGIPTAINGVNYPSLMFYPENMCDMFTRLVITNLTSTQMTLHMIGMLGVKKTNCIHDTYVQEHGEYPVNFPKDVILTKQ